jgi:uncharacterized membrane protein
MTGEAWPSTDLGGSAIAVLATLLLASVALVALEARHHPRRARLLASALLAAALVAVAVLRPRVARDGSRDRHAPLAVVVDDSRSMTLEKGRRDAERARAVERVRALTEGRPVRWLRTTDRGLEPFDPASPSALTSRAGTTDLGDVLAQLRDRNDFDPLAVVLVSDGREAPNRAGASEGSSPVFRPGVPVHTVAVGHAQRDVSIADVRVLGSAFAHGTFPVRVEVACHALPCGELNVTWEPAAQGGGASSGATSAVVDASSGRGAVELSVSFEQPGRHAATVRVAAPEGDDVPENDTRTVLLEVRRERVRMLHVAGRPTNDVRALRRFLKANSSIDLVSFFILRTQDDDPRASPSELSLIPFPVDELFEEHLASFDAVVVQDIDAEEYGLARHLRRVARYVDGGGGLVLVGGPHAFAAGGYDRSSLANALPTALEASRSTLLETFTPKLTPEGAAHPIVAAFAKAGGKLENVEGTWALGGPLPGASVLYEHPSVTTRAGTPMPVLALREVHAGRVLALGTDGTWRLGFSEAAATGSGSAYDALWDALIGWTLHDARFDPAPLQPLEPCVAGDPCRFTLPSGGADLVEERQRDGGARSRPFRIEGGALVVEGLGEGVVELEAKQNGAVRARGRVVIDRVGQEWIDTRPDHELLARIAAATGGVSFHDVGEVDERILPRVRIPTSARHERPLFPPWALALAATLALGAHWYERRRFGLR